MMVEHRNPTTDQTPGHDGVICRLQAIPTAAFLVERAAAKDMPT
jgi:hypothetical protein